MREPDFPAKITGSSLSGGLYLYSWTEQVATLAGTGYQNASPARSGNTTVATAYERNNQLVATNTLVWMRFRGWASGYPVYDFDASAGTNSTFPDPVTFDDTVSLLGGATLEDPVTFSDATADSLAYFDPSKALKSVTIGAGLSFSGGTLSAGGGTAALTSTYIGVGDGSNLLSGSSAYVHASGVTTATTDASAGFVGRHLVHRSNDTTMTNAPGVKVTRSGGSVATPSDTAAGMYCHSLIAALRSAGVEGERARIDMVASSATLCDIFLRVYYGGAWNDAVKVTGSNGDVVIGATLTVPNTGLHLLDTNSSHDLIIAPGSDLSADRTLTITTGDASRTLTLSANLTVSATADVSGTNTGDQAIATQSDQETATSTTAIVTPGRQHYHPSAAKGFCRYDASSGTPTIDHSYNVASITDTAAGNANVLWSTDFSAATKNCTVATCGLAGARYYVDFAGAANVGSASTRIITANAAGTLTDCDVVCVVAFGDHA